MHVRLRRMPATRLGRCRYNVMISFMFFVGSCFARYQARNIAKITVVEMAAMMASRHHPTILSRRGWFWFMR